MPVDAHGLPAQPPAGASDTPVIESPSSSKARYEDFLHRRRLEQQGAKDGTTPPHAMDQNAPARTKRTRSFWVLLTAFWSLIRQHRRTTIACICTVTIASLIGLAMPASTKIAIDYVLTNSPGPSGLPDWVPTREPKQLLLIIGAVLMVLSVISVSVGIWGRYHMTKITHMTRAAMRRRVFNHAVRLPLHRVYELKSGGAASILREDAGQAADLLFSMLYNPWRAVVQLTGTLIILAWTDWLLLCGAVLLIPAAWFSQRTWIARIRPLFKAVRATRTTIDAHAAEAFGGMRVVRGFVRQRAESARFIRNNHFMSRQELLTWWWSRAIEIIWMVLLPAGSAGVLVYGGYRVIDGTLTIGDVMMFSAYLLMLLGPLEALSASATSIQAELASFDRVLDLLAEPEEFAGASGGAALIKINPSTVRGEISIRNVSFHYPKSETNVLEGVNLHVPAGSTVALIGPSGAGKTTLCNLVARFYDPTEGEILLDGRELRTIDVDAYRHLLGIVEQDVFLFDGTIRDNIGYARRDASMDDIVRAAQAANADGFISRLEHGYQTFIGERGVRLSGGQKQRIAIARAILADPRILILDEATSNLDTESESLIQQSLRDLMRGGPGQARPRTCFVIAHRLSTIRHADQIVVIDHGRVIEQGTHDELLARGSEGRYWQMLQRQMTRSEDQVEALQQAARATRA